MSYSRTTGTITHSAVTEDSDSDGTTYGFDVRYLYEVNGQRYQGDRYRYNPWSSSSRSAAKALEQSFPLGATVPVFHNIHVKEGLTASRASAGRRSSLPRIRHRRGRRRRSATA